MKTLKVFSCLLLLTYVSKGIAKADFTFSEPMLLGSPVNNFTTEHSASISTNGLELYFDAWQNGQTDVCVATRVTIDDGWSEAVPLDLAVNSTAFEWTPRISADGLELYFASNREGSQYSGFQIYFSRRQSINDEWQPAENLGDMINSSYEQTVGSISSDGLELYYSSDNKMYVATRVTISSNWTEKKAIAPTISGGFPSISPGRLQLLFSGSLPGGMGDTDIWMMTRASIDADWNTPINLGSPINSEISDSSPWISYDGSTILFTSGSPSTGTRPGGIGSADVWKASIDPVVDFNGDGVVAVKDVVFMTEHWGENYSLCDIGPTPLGDGIVDVQDLVILTEYMEPINRSLIAHWELDETEGDIAYNSIGDNHGVLSGNPTWQPNSGQVAGALEFYGVNDYFSTDSVLNPKDGPFSVFAWIKGGAPGQVVLSQIGGVNWLSTDPLEGKLMTELIPPIVRTPPPPLVSDFVIIDGDWHRIGFVWDGEYRTLYVDDILVVEDLQTGLAASADGLNIGCGSDHIAGTYWSGLIDDVRIYNRAVRP